MVISGQLTEPIFGVLLSAARQESGLVDAAAAAGTPHGVDLTGLLLWVIAFVAGRGGADLGAAPDADLLLAPLAVESPGGVTGGWA